MGVYLKKNKMETYRIWYDAEAGIVRMLWKGYANSAQFREGTRRMLEVLRETQASVVLGDIRDMVLISQEDQDWLTGNFLPVAIDAGFRAIALLRPQHYFNKVAVETIAYKVNREKLRISFFETEYEALNWLETERSLSRVPAREQGGGKLHSSSQNPTG